MKSPFAERYATMADEELADLALGRELLPEAESCLKAELANRGIGDLGPYQKLRDDEQAQLAARSEQRIAKQREKSGLMLRMLCGVCLLMAAVGLWQWHVGNERDAIGILVTVAIVFPSYWLYIKLRFVLVKWFLRP